MRLNYPSTPQLLFTTAPMSGRPAKEKVMKESGKTVRLAFSGAGQPLVGVFALHKRSGTVERDHLGVAGVADVDVAVGSGARGVDRSESGPKPREPAMVAAPSKLASTAMPARLL